MPAGRAPPRPSPAPRPARTASRACDHPRHLPVSALRSTSTAGAGGACRVGHVGHASPAALASRSGDRRTCSASNRPPRCKAGAKCGRRSVARHASETAPHSTSFFKKRSGTTASVGGAPASLRAAEAAPRSGAAPSPRPARRPTRPARPGRARAPPLRAARPLPRGPAAGDQHRV